MKIGEIWKNIHVNRNDKIIGFIDQQTAKLKLKELQFLIKIATAESEDDYTPSEKWVKIQDLENGHIDYVVRSTFYRHWRRVN